MPLQVDRPADLAAFVGTELQSEAFALTQSDIDRSSRSVAIPVDSFESDSRHMRRV
jgi:hypothetical protein